MTRFCSILALVVAGLLAICLSNVHPATAASNSGSVSVSIAASAAEGDAPYPVTKPKLVPPICTFLFGKDGKLVKPVATAKGIANRGICRDKNGNKVWGTQFSYTNLTVTGLADTDCPVKKDFGTTGESGVIPITLKGVTVAYTINVWVRRTAKHLASVRSNPRSTKSFTVSVPGKTVCPGDPPVVNDHPNSPSGSGNGGDASHGFRCGWGSGSLTYSGRSVDIVAAVDCSGNGQCKWVPSGLNYSKYGYTWYTGQAVCDNGVSGSPYIKIEVTYPDLSKCTMIVADVIGFPLPNNYGWAGSITVSAWVESSGRPLPNEAELSFETLTLGPLQGKGATRLC